MSLWIHVFGLSLCTTTHQSYKTQLWFHLDTSNAFKFVASFIHRLSLSNFPHTHYMTLSRFLVKNYFLRTYYLELLNFVWNHSSFQHNMHHQFILGASTWACKDKARWFVDQYMTNDPLTFWLVWVSIPLHSILLFLLVYNSLKEPQFTISSLA